MRPLHHFENSVDLMIFLTYPCSDSGLHPAREGRPLAFQIARQSAGPIFNARALSPSFMAK
jgi:hypothetical protein